MFDDDIRSIVPQIAMSGGTMIACACKEIIMGKQSNLGPIDPQLGGMSAEAVLYEFEQAANEIKENPSKIPLWQIIINKYSPTLINECQNAIAWSAEILENSLQTNMFKDSENSNEVINKIVNELSSHGKTKSHSRHISMTKCRDIGLNIIELEDDQDLQDTVLNLHHISIISFLKTTAVKLIENSDGKSFTQNAIPKK
jgi:membrane-bound ClpP family serine protease